MVKHPTVTILTLAFLLRVTVALAFPNVLAPDEMYQFLEQAHRLVFGQGLVPWEFQVGLRNWLIPLILAAPMVLVHFFTPNPLAGLVLIRILLCAASLPIVWCAMKWGHAAYGPRGAWIAGLFTACWPDLILLAPHPLEEVFGADVLVPAIYFAATMHPESRLSRSAWAGFLLGLAFTFRMQLAPAVALGGIFLCGRNAARWRISLLTGVLPVIAAGMLDWFTWGQPFRSFWLNVDLNVFHNVAAQEFGTNPFGYFLFILTLQWLWTFPVLIFLLWRGAKILPLPVLAAIVVIAAHSLLSHKEYRFIFPAIALAVPVAGVALAGLFAQPKPAGQKILWAGLLAGPLCSPWPYFLLLLWSQSFTAFEAIAAHPPCEIAIGDCANNFLPLDILLPATTHLTALTENPTAGLIIASKNTMAPKAQYKLTKCFPGPWLPLGPQPAGFCVWTRTQPSCLYSGAPLFPFRFPDAAKPFIIPDRLTDK